MGKTDQKANVAEAANSAATATPEERPFPWNVFSGSTYFSMGLVILFFIIIPSMSVIVLANIAGYFLYRYLYEKSRLGRSILEVIRGAQRKFFHYVGHFILLDPRDSSYLTWMTWGVFIQPALFYWVWTRYETTAGRLEVSVFLVYHLLRVGPRHQLFAHHATLVHKEGHANRNGLFCNPFARQRQMLSKPVRRLFADHINAGTAGLFYGTIPNHYATAHNKIHHRWHNDTGDVHTNMDLERTEFSSYILYLPRFTAYWLGISPLILFYSRGEYELFFNLVCGMVYYYSWSVFVWYKMGFVFYWAFVLYPLLEGASFLGLIAYMWHMFSEPSDPQNQYVNSITILRGENNVWNEDYHVVHHHHPGVHWSEMPHSFEQYLDKYIECRATIFAECEQGKLIAWIFGKAWDALTDHFVDLQCVFSDGTRNSSPDKRLTMKQVAAFERELRSNGRGKSDERIAAHHAEIKGTLLSRLKYHYLGDRKMEWCKWNAEISSAIRNFDESTNVKKCN